MCSCVVIVYFTLIMQPKPNNHKTTKPQNKFSLPYLGYGLGLRSKHYNHILANKPKVDWFEIISENYMNSTGRPREMLDAIRAHYSIVMHGVSLSIGSTDPLNMEYLRCLKKLADDIKPVWISDHLCWTGINGKNTHDLLPVPLTQETLEHITNRIKQVQDFLGRPLLLENPSTYLTFKADNIPEHEFMAMLSEKADCALLLDVNNIYVACFNHRLNAHEYINAIPANRVVQIHLAGHTNKGTYIVDTHDDHVTAEVWDLYNYAINRMGKISTMIEWDGNIPEFPVLEAELAKARERRIESGEWRTEKKPNLQSPLSNLGLQQLQANMQNAVLASDIIGVETWIVEKENFTPAAQIGVYIDSYRLRLAGILEDDYKKTAEYLGDDFKNLVREYIETVPSVFYDASKYSWQFADWLLTKTSSSGAALSSSSAALSSSSAAMSSSGLTRGSSNNMDSRMKCENDRLLIAVEVADIERKMAEGFNIKNSPAATSANFAGLTPQEFMGLKIAPRSASFLEHYPAKHGYLIIYRHEDKSYRLQLEKEEFIILSALKNGKNIGDALELLPENTDPAKIQNWFASWVKNHVLSLTK